MSENKEFSQKLYDENDTAGDKRLRELFDGSKYTLRRVKKYGVDFEVYKDNKHIGYIEVEVKLGWNAHKYPFSDVRFPKRKGKFLKLDKRTYFVMFNKDLSRHLAVLERTMAMAPVVHVDTKYMKNEPFFAVALENVVWDKFSNLSKSTS